MTQAKLIQDIIIAVRHLGIYPDKHPIVVNSFKAIFGQITELLQGKESLSLNVSPDNKIVINNEPLLDKSAGDLDGFVPLFKKLNIEDLVFASGIAEAEIGAFIRLFTCDAQEFKKYDDINKLFAEKGITHLKAKQFSYIKVEKGKEGQVSIGQQRVERLKAQLKDGVAAVPAGSGQGVASGQLEKDMVEAVE